MTDITTITTLIKKAMKEHGINQTELSKKTGIAQSGISAMLSGSRDIKLSSICLIINAIPVKISLIK